MSDPGGLDVGIAQQIQALPSDLIHLIAAGEVIDSIGAVVRELVDNALDAKADRLNLVLWPDDWGIQLSDNGTGLTQADLAVAASPHSTSKLRGSLDQISSLGFRGEALHSIAQFGDLSLSSCPQGDEDGWHATYDRQGQLLDLVPTAIAPGTVVRVTRLFESWRFRRQTLTPIQQQFKGVQTLIYNYALCHPHITWQVWQGDRLWFHLPASQSSVDVVPLVLPSVDASVLRSNQVSLPPNPDAELGKLESRAGKLELVLGLPDRCHRHRPDWIRIAVNGRCVQVHGALQSGALLQPLEQAILKAFRQTIPRHRYPLCFAHFHLPPENIDWNRHPAKSEIYLRNLTHWQAQLSLAIKQLLGFNPQYSEPSGQRAIANLLTTAEKKEPYNLVPSNSESVSKEQSGLGQDQSPLPFAVSLSDSLPQQSLLKLKAIAQLHQTYILCEHPAGLWLVEQHVAHERVLYDALEADWDFVEVSPPERLSGLTHQQVENLETLGIDIQPFGPNVWAVRTLPRTMLEDRDRIEGLKLLSQTDDLTSALATVACRCAIRNGTVLEPSQMQQLVEAWQKTKTPRTCPHGRPIYLSLEEKDLARFFRRNWIINP